MNKLTEEEKSVREAISWGLDKVQTRIKEFEAMHLNTFMEQFAWSVGYSRLQEAERRLIAKQQKKKCYVRLPMPRFSVAQKA